MLLGKGRLRIGLGTHLHRALALFLRVRLFVPVYLLLDLAFGGGDSIGGARKAVFLGWAVAGIESLASNYIFPL
jgi:hypothetical protein